MDSRWFFVVVVVAVSVLSPPTPCHGASLWEDIVTCVHTMTNESSTAVDNNTEPDAGATLGNFSIGEIFTMICSNQNGFVRCLDNSLKHSSDDMAQVIGTLFESDMVIKAYKGLCSNISAIEQNGVDVFGCLVNTKLTTCQTEMADYFFYMELISKLGAPSEQLSRTTMETLLCSLTAQRRDCEVQALKGCNNELGNIMEDFYKQTQPHVCTEKEKVDQFGEDNKIN